MSKFGLTIAAEKAWSFDADMRRVASEEVPAFTQDLPEHDLLLVADERGDFARYIPYNTWVPRPVAGSAQTRQSPLAPPCTTLQWGERIG